MASIKSYAVLLLLSCTLLWNAEVEGRDLVHSGVVKDVAITDHNVRALVASNRGFLWGNGWPWGAQQSPPPNGVDLTVVPLSCSVKRYDNVMFVGTTVGTSRNVMSPEVCVGVCWQFRKSRGQCLSVNYSPQTHICELKDKILSQNNEAQRRYDVVYLIPINCEEISGAGPVAPPTPVLPAPAPVATPLPEPKCGYTFVTPSIKLNEVQTRNAKSRIVGGTPAEAYSYPWMASLQQGTKHFCGGAVIRVSNMEESDIILTASHCVEERPNDLYVTVGTYYLAECGDGCEFHVKAATYQKHPLYDNVKTINDIALIKLVKPVPFGPKIQPVCLPPQSEQPTVGTPAVIAGWGTLDESIVLLPGKLMQVWVPVMPNNDCQQYYPKDVNLQYHFCAGHVDGKHDSCQGDSGGPLVFNTTQGWMVRGLVSFGEGCARAKKPGVYTRVSDYRHWIDETARQLTSVPLQ